MSIVERLKEAAQNPVDYDIAKDWREGVYKNTRSFLGSKIDLDDYLSHASALDTPEWVITLPWPGPLYGLLRESIDFDPDTAKKITYHERDHFDVARNNGVYIEIQMAFSYAEEQPFLDQDFKVGSFDIFVIFEIPDDMEEDKAKKLIYDILTAPEKLSPDDLERLPENYTD